MGALSVDVQELASRTGHLNGNEQSSRIAASSRVGIPRINAEGRGEA